MNEALLLLYMNASLCSLKLGQGSRAKKYGRKVGFYEQLRSSVARVMKLVGAERVPKTLDS